MNGSITKLTLSHIGLRNDVVLPGVGGRLEVVSRLCDGFGAGVHVVSNPKVEAVDGTKRWGPDGSVRDELLNVVRPSVHPEVVPVRALRHNLAVEAEGTCRLQENGQERIVGHGKGFLHGESCCGFHCDPLLVSPVTNKDRMFTFLRSQLS